MTMKIDTDLIKNKKYVSSIKPYNQKYSQEYKVLAILRYLYPPKFSNMVKGESPDFQDNISNIGIEVVSAVKEGDMEASRAFSKLCRPESRTTEKNKKRIESSNYSIIPVQDDKVTISTMGTSEGEKIVFQKSIRKKSEKLRQYREKFKTIGLAILLPEIPTTYAEEHCLEWISEVLNESQNLFDFVYVLSHRFCIYYDTHKNASEKRFLTAKEYRLLSIIARMTAEGELSLSDSEWL